jgi:hypothetical protein
VGWIKLAQDRDWLDVEMFVGSMWLRIGKDGMRECGLDRADSG